MTRVLLRPFRRAAPVIVATVVALAVALPIVAADTPRPVEVAGVVEALEQADRIVPEATDLVSVYNSGALRSDVEQLAIEAATDAGAEFTVRHAASLAMTTVTRDGATVQSAPGGFAYPMGTTVLDTLAVEALMGDVVADALADDTIVMSQLTASLRGAEAGDDVTLLSATAQPVSFTIGAVVPDDVTGGTELLLSPGAAERLGLERKSSVVMWNFVDRAAIDEALDANGLEATNIRIRRSWEPFDPDSTLGMAESKELLGEFAYRVNANGSVSIDDAWKAESLPAVRELLNESVRIRAQCHVEIVPALRAAFAEVVAAGVGGTFNVYDANRAGGCYNPRFNRLTQSSTIGFLSRHTWAMAIDTNTVGSCQGCAPPDIDCRAVQIFRKHGFAWGGNFLTPDGMHFEFVGERRDEYPYPSRFCANDVEQRADDVVLVGDTLRPTIFSDSGLIAEAEH